MNILLNCVMSGIGYDEFTAQGHHVVTCDLSPTIHPRARHWQCDAIEAMKSYRWDMMIAHPPCTYLSNSGAKHLYVDGKRVNGRDPVRWTRMYESAEFFKELLYADIDKVCIENPVQHRYALAHIEHTHTQAVHPWWFGTGETKETRLWLSNLPALVPTQPVDGRYPRVWMESPGVKNGLTRQQRRSLSDTGMYAAMVAQWGTL